MNLHILTTDTRVVEQLTKLLDDGAHKYSFYEDLERLISNLPKFRKTDVVLYDLQLESALLAFDALLYASKKTHLVAFESVEADLSEAEFNFPSNAKNCLLLSTDERKSASRLKKLIHEMQQRDAQAKAKRKRAKKKAKSPTVAASAQGVVSSTGTSDGIPVTITRYLKAKSSAMQQFLVEICEATKKASFILIDGEDGAEFELVAREVNFRANGDQSPLFVVDPMRVCLDSIEESANADDRIFYCYLGLSYELTALTLERLNLYFKALKESDKPPHLCLILGHVDQSDCYLEPEMLAFVKEFRSMSQVLAIPNMEDRRDDISLIAQSMFTTMRIAHPFLLTRTLTSGAIQSLEEKHKSLSYSSLVRVIRNAMALTERDALTETELRNFSDDSPTSQHLIESLADEKYFKNQVGAA